MYHGYHFVYLVLFLFIFYGIFFKKNFAWRKKKGYFWKLAQIILKDKIISLVLFIMKIRFLHGKSIANIILI